MKKLMFLILIILYSCSPSSSTKKMEAVKTMSSYDCLKEIKRWMEISDEYLKKQMYYVGRNDMTGEDQVKFKEYSALGRMARDSAKFYQDKFDMLVRTNELKKKYNDLVSADSLNKLQK